MGRTYRILIADRTQATEEALQDALAPESYEAIRADNGAEALLQAHSGRPDLILLDLCLPVLDGIRTMELLHADPLTRDIPVVAVGSADGDAAATRMLAAGAAFCLQKPLVPDEVRAVVGRLLSDRPCG